MEVQSQAPLPRAIIHETALADIASLQRMECQNHEYGQTGGSVSTNVVRSTPKTFVNSAAHNSAPQEGHRHGGASKLCFQREYQQEERVCPVTYLDSCADYRLA